MWFKNLTVYRLPADWSLSAAELEDIKSVLRDQLSSDPGLRDLVQTATGREPEPPQD